jgi:GTPase
MAPPNVLEENMIRLFKILRNRVQRIPFKINDIDDVQVAVRNIKSHSIVPILLLSNVSGYNVDLLKSLLFQLDVRNKNSKLVGLPFELWMDTHFMITGFGTVVGGLIKSGSIQTQMKVFVGPLKNGEFIQSKIKSIHVKHHSVKEAYCGQYACLCLKNFDRNLISKGMVVLGEDVSRKIYWSFLAKIRIIQSTDTTIRIGYQPFLHIGQVRQSASIIEIVKVNAVNDEDFILRAGDQALVKLKFINHAEFIKKDTPLIFREGKLRAVGNIVELYEN